MYLMKSPISSSLSPERGAGGYLQLRKFLKKTHPNHLKTLTGEGQNDFKFILFPPPHFSSQLLSSALLFPPSYRSNGLNSDQGSHTRLSSPLSTTV